MPRWAILIEIAGVSFTGCRVELVNPEGFNSPFRGSYEYTNDGGIEEQSINIGVKGIPFGLSMESAQITLIKNLRDAIVTAQTNRDPFRVRVTDELYTIDVLATVDWKQQWIKHNQPKEGYVENVQLRFVSKGPYI